MNSTNFKDRQRFAKDLEQWLIYFSNQQQKSITLKEAQDIATQVIENADLKNPAFKHKGPSWLAREIISNRKREEL